jgi:hypothetical protein
MLIITRRVGDPETSDVTIQYSETSDKPPWLVWRAHADVLRAKSRLFAACLNETSVRDRRAVPHGNLEQSADCQFAFPRGFVSLRNEQSSYATTTEATKSFTGR